MRILTDKDVELRFVYLDSFGLLEGNDRSRPRGVLEERDLAEDFLLVLASTMIATLPRLMANMLCPSSPSRKIVVPRG